MLVMLVKYSIVTTKLIEAARPPESVTCTVMVFVPVTFVAGITVTVRFESAPPNTMFWSGTRLVFEESAERTSSLAAVSKSPITNAIGGVGRFGTVSWLETVVMMGRALVMVKAASAANGDPAQPASMACALQ